MSSRLFTEVRERRGLGYYVHAGNTAYTDAGTFYSSAGVDVERVDEAITTILGEMRKIAAEPVPADELEKARGYAKGRFVLRLESPQGTIQYGLRREVLEGEIEDPDELLRQLDARHRRGRPARRAGSLRGQAALPRARRAVRRPGALREAARRREPTSASCFAARPRSPQTSSTPSTTDRSGHRRRIDELRAALGGPLPDDADRAAGRHRGARARSRARSGRHAERPLLRLRHRWRAAGCARGRLARRGLGSERGPRRLRPVRRGRRGGRGRLAQGSPRPAGRLPPSRFVTGCQMAHIDLPRRRAARACSRAPAGTSSGTGLQGAPRVRVVAGAKRHVDDRPRAPPARSRHRGDRRRPGRRSGSDARRMPCAAALAAERRADDRLRPGRRGEHRSLRRLARRSPICSRDAAPGCTSTAPSGCGPPRRPRCATSSRASSAPTPGRPTRHKWLNVPYDCGHRVLSRTRSRTARRWRYELRTSSQDAGARATRWTGRPSSRGAPAASPSTRRSARSAARASPSSSSAAATRARVRRRASPRSGLRGAERRRAEPGALPLRRRRDDHARARTRSGERRGVDGRDDVGRPAGDPGLGLELADERERHRRARVGGASRRARAAS